MFQYCDVTIKCLHKPVNSGSVLSFLKSKLRESMRYRWENTHNSNNITISFNGLTVDKFTPETWDPVIYINEPFTSGIHYYQIFVEKAIYTQ
jgi:hypothetical protein